MSFGGNPSYLIQSILGAPKRKKNSSILLVEKQNATKLSFMLITFQPTIVLQVTHLASTLQSEFFQLEALNCLVIYFVWIECAWQAIGGIYGVSS